MNGGVTYKDMDERKECWLFVEYMRHKNPMTLKIYWEQWQQDLQKKQSTNELRIMK